MTNTRALLSPAVRIEAQLPGQIAWFGQYGCDRRYPNPAALYFDNPKLNYIAETKPEPGRIKTWIAATGVRLNRGPFLLSYRVENIFIRNPLVFTTDETVPYNPVWIITQDSVRFEERISQSFEAEASFSRISDRLSLNITHSDRATERYNLPFWTFGLRNEFRLQKHFVKGNLFTRLTFTTRLRPQVWGIDFHTDDTFLSTPVLKSYLIFDLGLDFTIRTFNFYTKIENVTNQVVTYDPGYYLPGPTIRWGILWEFGD